MSCKVLDQIFEQDHVPQGCWPYEGGYYLVTDTASRGHVVPAWDVEPLHSIQDVLNKVGLSAEQVEYIEKKKGFITPYLIDGVLVRAFDSPDEAQLYMINYFADPLDKATNDTTYCTSVGNLRIWYVLKEEMEFPLLAQGIWMSQYLGDCPDKQYMMVGNTKGEAIKALLTALGEM
jgi:hypothetical protein